MQNTNKNANTTKAKTKAILSKTQKHNQQQTHPNAKQKVNIAKRKQKRYQKQ